LFVLDKTNNQVITVNQGDDVSAYIKNLETKTDSTGTTVSYLEANDGYQFLKVDSGANALDVAKTKEESKLYDSTGTEVSGVRLREYFNDFGVYSDNSLYLDSGSRTKISTASISQFVNKTSTTVANDLSFSLHVGADSASSNKITTNIASMTAASLGISVLKSTEAGIVDDSGDKATDAIDLIAEALQKVSTQRSALGAVQNRLEHTIKNLDNIVENTTSAESQIRDTDMATEMVTYSNSNILAQAGQSMLAQANQANQGVLSLLG
jgi:flagellin